MVAVSTSPVPFLSALHLFGNHEIFRACPTFPPPQAEGFGMVAIFNVARAFPVGPTPFRQSRDFPRLPNVPVAAGYLANSRGA